MHVTQVSANPKLGDKTQGIFNHNLDVWCNGRYFSAWEKWWLIDKKSNLSFRFFCNKAGYNTDLLKL